MLLSSRAVLFSFAFLAAAAPALAAPISFSFDTVANFEQPGGGTSGTPVGEPSNVLGLVIPGQVGPWNSIVVGNGDFRDTYSASRSLTVDGVTVTFNPGGTDTYQTFRGGGGDVLRGSVPFLRANAAGATPATSSSIAFTISGLEAGYTYDVIAFGQLQRGVPENPTDFSILGHDAGNGVGNPVTLDGEFDGNFLSVAAPGGTITGIMSLRTGRNFASIGGLQVRVVPEPATMSLLGLGVIGLAALSLRRRRRRNAQANASVE